MSTFRNVYLENGLLSDGGIEYPSMKTADEFSKGTASRPRVAVLESFAYRGVGIHPKTPIPMLAQDKDPTEGLEFVVWVPGSPRPITTRYKTRAQAQAIAHKLAEKEGVETFVCAMVDQVLPPPKAKSERKALL